MRHVLLIGLMLMLMSGCGGSQQKDTGTADKPSGENFQAKPTSKAVQKTNEPEAPRSASTPSFPPLQYTARNGHGSRRSLDHESVLSTLPMNDDQLRQWVQAADAGSLAEHRSATLYESGYSERIERNDSGELRYTVTSPLGRRTSSDRNSVLATVTMTEDQIRQWAAAKDDTAIRERRTAVLGRDASGPVRSSIRDIKGSRSSRDRDSVKATLSMTEDQIRKWVEATDAKALQEDRSASFSERGYSERIGHDASGALEYTVRTPLGDRMGRDRDSVLKTLTMSEGQIMEWVEASDKEALQDERLVTFARAGYSETITRRTGEDVLVRDP